LLVLLGGPLLPLVLGGWQSLATAGLSLVAVALGPPVPATAQAAKQDDVFHNSRWSMYGQP
jgi:hypothetical protein